MRCQYSPFPLYGCTGVVRRIWFMLFIVVCWSTRGLWCCSDGIPWWLQVCVVLQFSIVAVARRRRTVIETWLNTEGFSVCDGPEYHPREVTVLSFAWCYLLSVFSLLLTKVKLEQACLGGEQALITCKRLLETWKRVYESDLSGWVWRANCGKFLLFAQKLTYLLWVKVFE